MGQALVTPYNFLFYTMTVYTKNFTETAICRLVCAFTYEKINKRVTILSDTWFSSGI